MNQQATRVLIGGLWLSSVAAAFFFGQSGSNVSPSVVPLAGNSSQAAADAADIARAGRVVEKFSGNISGDLDPGAKKNVSNIIARARVELGSGMNGMMNIRGMLRAIAPLTELDDSQLQEALAEVEKTVREPQQKMMFYSLLLGQWAETDGPAALAYAEKNLKSKGPFDFGVRASILGSWARQDPDAVWRWYQKEREKGATDPNSQMMIASVFAGTASKDLDLAFSRLSSLEDPDRQMALNGIANTAADERGRKRLLDRAEGLAPELRRPLQENVVRTWGMTDPEAAIKWIRSRPEEDQPSLRTAAGNMVMMSDPARGAELLLEGVAEKDRPRVYDTVVGQWAYRDPRGAAEWLTKQPQGPELDGARRTFASVVVQRDPSAAMDWAKSVVNEDQRNSSVQQVYSQWRAKDANAADAALNASGIPADKITAFREAAKNGIATERR
jgi:hypothetical protein